MHQLRIALCPLLVTALFSGLSFGVIIKRSAAPFGLTVLRTILRNAKVVSVTDARVALVKPGGWSQALDDFGALSPGNINELSTKLDNGVVLTNGLVGDKGIQLVKGNAMQETMLSIFKVGDRDNKIVIFYPDDTPLAF